MPLDLRHLRPAELLRLVNSTPAGEVLGEAQLRRQRARAGARIGTARTVDLVRYVGWLATKRKDERGKRKAEEEKPPAPPAGSAAYEAMKEQARARNARASRSGRDIGPVPKVAHPKRKNRCRKDFRSFSETYFPHTFTKPWSDDHLAVIRTIQATVLFGGLFALAMPRGTGKTALCEAACLWATLYGHREFVALIAANETKGEESIESIQVELETNDLLAEDFPEVTFPILKLEGIANRCAGQLCQGERTHITWRSRSIVLPTIAGSQATGRVLRAAGLTGAVRGMRYKRPDGATVRPDLVIIDDPQTKDSAKSSTQCADRLSLIGSDVLGLAGPGKNIAAVMPCTVIYPGDVADQLLDRQKHPRWQGARYKLLTSLPNNLELWEQYAEVRTAGKLAGRGEAPANEFYRAHRKELDAGAKASWNERFKEDEVSAIQHGMHLLLDDAEMFWAEMQNQPRRGTSRDDELSADQICQTINRHERGLVPVDCTRLTAFVDVQSKLLYWIVCAWGDGFRGAVVDYGTFPEQARRYFSLASIRRTLAQATKTASLEAAIYAALESLIDRLGSREWPRDDGLNLHLERILIDANWGASTDVVYRFCRQSRQAALLLPSHGKFIGAASSSIPEWKRNPGETTGLNWRIAKGKRAIRHAIYDTNFWKSFVIARLATPAGGAGALTLFGHSPDQHRLLADHLTSETRVRVEAKGRKVDEWKQKPDRPDNHWLDCLVGAAVAASIGGLSLKELAPQPAPRRRRNVSYL